MKILNTAKAIKRHSNSIITSEFSGYNKLTTQQIKQSFNNYFPNTKILKINKFKMYRKVRHKVYIKVSDMEEFNKWAKE